MKISELEEIKLILKTSIQALNNAIAKDDLPLFLLSEYDSFLKDINKLKELIFSTKCDNSQFHNLLNTLLSCIKDSENIEFNEKIKYIKKIETAFENVINYIELNEEFIDFNKNLDFVNNINTNGFDKDEVIQYVNSFVSKNYNYLWLNGRIEVAKKAKGNKNILITGNSYALAGIKANFFDNCYNLSMSSQDLYYNICLAKLAIESSKKSEGGEFDRHIMIEGSYFMFSDLSKSVKEREIIISDVFYPLLNDSHNWNNPHKNDLWNGLNVKEEMKNTIYDISKDYLGKESDYYTIKRERNCFNFGSKSWQTISSQERDSLAKFRTESHNKFSKYNETLEENITLLSEYYEYAKSKNIKLIVVFAPYSQEYNKYTDHKQREGSINAIKKVSEDIEILDLNDNETFVFEDFADTDHLNDRGAIKLSSILVEKYGK